ncbi:hypothetical protein ACS0TY_001478 [Phlomoides rotata]
MWNMEKFQRSSVWEIRGMLIVNGELWDNIATVAEQHKDSYVGIMGDFNAIRDPSERCGRSQNTDTKDMEKFEDFINLSNLLEIKMIGKKFT